MPRERHGWIGYERNQRSFASVCACGWLSGWFTNPALAGSAMDDHLVDQRQPPLVDQGA